jgi:hypothetical protein
MKSRHGKPTVCRLKEHGPRLSSSSLHSMRQAVLYGEGKLLERPALWSLFESSIVVHGYWPCREYSLCTAEGHTAHASLKVQEPHPNTVKSMLSFGRACSSIHQVWKLRLEDGILGH